MNTVVFFNDKTTAARAASAAAHPGCFRADTRNRCTSGWKPLCSVPLGEEVGESAGKAQHSFLPQGPHTAMQPHKRIQKQGLLKYQSFQKAIKVELDVAQREDFHFTLGGHATLCKSTGPAVCIIKATFKWQTNEILSSSFSFLDWVWASGFIPLREKLKLGLLWEEKRQI